MTNKVMFIGSKSNIGAGIIKKYNADSFSKSTGYDIDIDTVCQDLANKSLDYDVVIVHAFTENNSQMRVLHRIVDKWYEENKHGNIIVTSSIAGSYTFYKSTEWIYYSALKTALNKYCHMISKGCIDQKYKFLITNILPGTLGEKGITAEQYCSLVDFVLDNNTPYIPELTAETVHANI